jgi:hypothetical protein
VGVGGGEGGGDQGEEGVGVIGVVGGAGEDVGHGGGEVGAVEVADGGDVELVSVLRGEKFSGGSVQFNEALVLLPRGLGERSAAVRKAMGAMGKSSTWTPVTGWLHQQARGRWPRRSLRTAAPPGQILTPQRSQIMPLYCSPLYLPHSQRLSMLGPKVRGS